MNANIPVFGPRHSLLRLARVTGALLLRRLGLYTILVILSVAAEGALVRYMHAPLGEGLANALVLPIFATIVYAFAGADARNGDATGNVWLRVLERVWAVIVIDFITFVIAASSATSGAQTLAAVIVGSLELLLVVLFTFVDVAAVLDDEESWVLLIPHAFVKGVTIAWSRGTLIRCFILYALQLAVGWIAFGTLTAFQHYRIAGGEFWANLALTTVLYLPICVYTVVVYLDAAGVGISALAADDTVQ